MSYRVGVPKFIPPLSRAKQQSLSGMDMGLQEKVVVLFDTEFWPRDRYAFGFVKKFHRNDPAADRQGLYFPMVVNLQKSHGASAVELWVSEQDVASGKMNAMSDKEVVDDALAQLLVMFFGAPNPASSTGIAAMESLSLRMQTFTVTRWMGDPFSRGSWTALLPKGVLRKDLQELQKPEYDGRLFFAGEATGDEEQGTIRAAFLSGLREAGRLLGCCAIWFNSDTPREYPPLFVNTSEWCKVTVKAEVSA